MNTDCNRKIALTLTATTRTEVSFRCYFYCVALYYYVEVLIAAHVTFTGWEAFVTILIGVQLWHTVCWRERQLWVSCIVQETNGEGRFNNKARAANQHTKRKGPEGHF